MTKDDEKGIRETQRALEVTTSSAGGRLHVVQILSDSEKRLGRAIGQLLEADQRLRRTGVLLRQDLEAIRMRSRMRGTSLEPALGPDVILH